MSRSTRVTTRAAEENVGPFGEGFIGRDENGRGEVPAGDDLEEEVGVAVVVVEVSDLVDCQKLRAGEATQSPGEGGVGVLGGEFVERGMESDGVATAFEHDASHIVVVMCRTG